MWYVIPLFYSEWPYCVNVIMQATNGRTLLHDIVEVLVIMEACLARVRSAKDSRCIQLLHYGVKTTPHLLQASSSPCAISTGCPHYIQLHYSHIKFANKILLSYRTRCQVKGWQEVPVNK